MLEDELDQTQSPAHARRLIGRIRDLRRQLAKLENRPVPHPRSDLQQVAGEMTTDLLVGVILFGVLRKAIERDQKPTLSAEEEQQRVDAIAAELLADVDIRF